MIQKHAIPILEFDDNSQAVIMPNHEGLDLHLPKKCVYAFLGEEIDRYAREVGADCVGEFVSATKTYPVYVVNYKGEEVCLAQAPVGSAPAAQFMDWSWWQKRIRQHSPPLFPSHSGQSPHPKKHRHTSWANANPAPRDQA